MVCSYLKAHSDEAPQLILLSGVLSATITSAPKPTCPANCTIRMQAFEHWFWQSIVLTTT